MADKLFGDVVKDIRITNEQPSKIVELKKTLETEYSSNGIASDSKPDGDSDIIQKDHELLQLQDEIDKLEVLEMSVQTDGINQARMIVRDEWPSRRVGNERLYKHGTDVFIGIPNTEKMSAHNQYKEIIKAAAEPYLELMKHGLVEAIIIDGSVIDDPKMPGDLDMLVIGHQDTVKYNSELANSLSPAARLMYERMYAFSIEGADLQRLKIVGDTITTQHRIDIALMSRKAFLDDFMLEGTDKAARLDANRQLMMSGDKRKAESYEGWQHTNAQTTVLLKGIVIAGDGVYGNDGKNLFPRRDDELLK